MESFTFTFVMGAGVILCIFGWHVISVQSLLEEQHGVFFQELPGFSKSFPFENYFDFPSYDYIFSSWEPWFPDLNMFPEMYPLMSDPKLHVNCDESQLTLLVGKQFGQRTLTKEEIQLGSGCRSNGELQNHFVFTYSVDQCGTVKDIEDGHKVFLNTLYINVTKPLSSWWQIPSNIHITCMPMKSGNSRFPVPKLVPKTDRRFKINTMDSSWTNIDNSNVYKRGQVVNLQISAKTKPNEQLFIQSCFLSASPNPQTRLEHAIIKNRGCSVTLGSYPTNRFVESKTPDVVNVALNSTYLISGMYIHCSLIISDQGVSSGSKSCNYNFIRSRWEDLGGNVEVCACCSSECEDLSVNHHFDGAEAIISTGPLVIEEVTSPGSLITDQEETSRSSYSSSMQADAAMPEDVTSGASVLRKTSELQPLSFPKVLLLFSQDPVTRLTLWQPGLAQDAGQDFVSSELADNLNTEFDESYTVLKDLHEKVHPTTEQSSNEISGVAPLNVMADESQGNWHESLKSVKEVPQAYDQLTLELNTIDLSEADVISGSEGANDKPIIRSKLQFSKNQNGTQTLSYEEEIVMRNKEQPDVTEIPGDWEPRRKSLLSAWLDLLRKMDKAE